MGHILGFKIPYFAVFVLIVVLMGFFFLRMPTGFLPDEDQGVLLTLVQLPPGSTQEQTLDVLKKVRDYFLTNEKKTVEECLTIAGMSTAGRGQDQGMVYIKLKDWDLRDSPELKADAIVKRAMPAFSKIRNARIYRHCSSRCY